MQFGSNNSSNMQQFYTRCYWESPSGMKIVCRPFFLGGMGLVSLFPGQLLCFWTTIFKWAVFLGVGVGQKVQDEIP